MFDVITVGSATVDIFAHTNFSEMKKMIDSSQEPHLLAYPIGAKILINKLNFTTGGGGTNTAVCLSRLGHKVAWIGKLGSDVNAEVIKAELRKEGVTILAAKGDGLSGCSIILDSIEHDRTILAYKGENNTLEFDEIQKNKLKTRWFYFSSMMEKSFNTLEHLAKYASKNKIMVAFNASQYLAKKGPVFLKNILINTTIFILNKEEAELLTHGTDIYKMLVELAKMGPSINVITDGKNGSYTYDGKHIYKSIPNKIKVVETTGAGDAFAASFVSGYMRKKDIGFSIQLANANAESVIQHHGAKNRLLRYAEALKIIKHYPCKIKKHLM